MRDSLTVFAVIVIAILTIALVGPYFIDWNAHRAMIEARLSHAAGTPVTIAGPIDVKLLPEPVFRLGRVTLGRAGVGQAHVTAASIEVEIALTSLMRGEVEVVEARLEAPELELTAGPDGKLSLGLPKIADPAAISFQHFAVHNGTARFGLQQRGSVTLQGLDLEGEAAALNGPFKVTGTFATMGGARRPFRLATGAIDDGRMRVKLTLEAGAPEEGGMPPPTIDLDGTLLAAAKPPPSPPGKAASVKPGSAPGPASPAAAGPGFEGLVTVSGERALMGSKATVPWRLTGHVFGDVDRLTTADLEFRAGADLRAVIATGEGEVRFGGDLPGAVLRLHGPQCDLDRLAVAPADSGAAAPVGFDLLSQLAQFAGDPDWLAALPLRLDLDYAFDTATAGPETFRDIAGAVHLDRAGAPRLSFAAAGPEGAHLKLDGTFEPGPEAVFRGTVEAGSRNLPRFAGWLAPALPNLATALQRMLPIRSFALAGQADVSRVGVAARNLTLSLDRSVFAGTLSYTREVGAERARLFADLSSDGLDLDALPDLSTPLMLGDLDLAFALEAKAVKISAAGYAPVDAGHVGLRLSKTGTDIRLDRLDADLAGARLGASAHFDGALLEGQAQLTAESLDNVAALLKRLLPNAATAALQARAPALSPADVSLTLRAAASPEGALLPTALALKGVAGGTRLAVDLAPDRPQDINPETGAVSAKITAEAPEAAQLMRQIGILTSPAAAVGPGRIEAEAHGSLSAGFDTSATASFGAARLSFQGRAKPRLGTGRLTAKGEDIVPMLRAASLFPAGNGPALPVEAEAELAWHDSNLALRSLGGHLGGAAFGGDVNIDLLPPSDGAGAARPALFGTLTLDRLPAWALFGLAFGAPQPTAAGAAWSDQAFGPPLAHLPRTELSLKIGALALDATREARNASLTLRADKGAVTLADLTGTIGGASLGANLTLRRDGAAAAMTGQITWAGFSFDLPAFAGRVGGVIDLGGTGTSAASLVQNLAGTGTLTLTDSSLPRSDPEALGRTAAAIDRQAREDPSAADFDADRVTGLLASELDRASLPLGTVTGPTTLALGSVRLGPLHVEGSGWDASAEAGFDIGTLELSLRTTLRDRKPIADWTGPPPEASVSFKGPVMASLRDIDARSFINGLQARAIARDQERIDIQQQDINERAFFNRRRKAIEADQQAARERAKAEADAAKGPDAASKAVEAGSRLEGKGSVAHPPPRVLPLPPLRDKGSSPTKPFNIRPPASLLDERGPRPQCRRSEQCRALLKREGVMSDTVQIKRQNSFA